MNREKLIRMAHESGFDVESWVTSVGCEVSGTHEELERFAEMIVRECADVAFKNVCYGNGEVGPESDILDHFGVER